MWPPSSGLTSMPRSLYSGLEHIKNYRKARAMLNTLTTPMNLASHGAARPATSHAAGHGVDRPDSMAPAASLPLDRRGRLKNGNRPGDFLAASRWGARTRCSGACRQPAMKNGRCRLHGGLSTGPRTPEGLARSRRARLIHDGRSAQVRALLREARLQARRTRALRARLTGPSAGHGVDRSVSNSLVGAACGRPPSSPTAPSSMGSRVNDPRACVARPYTDQSNGDVSAGHGVHRSISNSTTASGRTVPPRAPAASVFIRAHLCSSASPLSLLSAGHGVHRSILKSPPSDGARPA